MGIWCCLVLDLYVGDEGHSGDPVQFLESGGEGDFLANDHVSGGLGDPCQYVSIFELEVVLHDALSVVHGVDNGCFDIVEVCHFFFPIWLVLLAADRFIITRTSKKTQIPR